MVGVSLAVVATLSQLKPVEQAGGLHLGFIAFTFAISMLCAIGGHFRLLVASWNNDAELKRAEELWVCSALSVGALVVGLMVITHDLKAVFGGA
jgi:hypothetical protein